MNFKEKLVDGTSYLRYNTLVGANTAGKGESSNGRRAVSKTVNAGSTPASPAFIKTDRIIPIRFFIFCINRESLRARFSSF